MKQYIIINKTTNEFLVMKGEIKTHTPAHTITFSKNKNEATPVNEDMLSKTYHFVKGYYPNSHFVARVIKE